MLRTAENKALAEANTRGIKSPGSERLNMHRITCHQALGGGGRAGPQAPEILIWQVWNEASTSECLTTSPVVVSVLLALLTDNFCKRAWLLCRTMMENLVYTCLKRAVQQHILLGLLAEDDVNLLTTEMHHSVQWDPSSQEPRRGLIGCFRPTESSLPQGKVWFKYIHSFSSPSLN